MAYLLMFVTLLHLITLAMLFIATMEKVKNTVFQLMCKCPCCVCDMYFVSVSVVAVVVGVGRHAELRPVVQLQV